jgi:uncharacterized repeat protein (TIGR03803 family)
MHATHARRFNALVAVSILALSSCSGALQSNLTPARGSLTPSLRSPSLNYDVLYQFKGGSDGKFPRAGLTELNGTLYGTTYGDLLTNFGNVFAITTAGKETPLYSFAAGRDGSGPRAGLTVLDGTLYGTTEEGGSGDRGTVFSITTGGTERILHRFEGGINGARPIAGLLKSKDGRLLGATSDFALSRHGTIFSITDHKDSYDPLEAFGGKPDGAHPVAGLIKVHGALYGTTEGGGVSEHGTIFKTNLAGIKTLHSFDGGSDGARPYAGLTEISGMLYGTTVGGGGAGCAGSGCGTVFQINSDGTGYKVLHSFAGGTDGAHPKAGLTNVNGTLYGTTEYGGAQNLGTVFTIEVSRRSVERVIHTFVGGTDGSRPEAGLIYVDTDKTLYGTTQTGGAHNFGTVYSLSGI